LQPKPRANLDANLCREHVERLLAEENAVLAELECQLDREHEALAARDLTALEAAADTRQLHMVRLLKLEDERRAACSSHGFAADLRGLGQLLEWCDPQRRLANYYRDCVARAERCRASNDRNAALVTARMAQIEGMLGVLAGPTSAPLYGPRSKPAAPQSGARLSVEA
jgi:flagellar biosynthesis/type III secretory pathway chaperone